MLDESAVFYVSHGKWEFESKPIGHVEVAAGDAFLLFPEAWSRYRPLKGTGWATYWAHFRGKEADWLLQQGFIRPEEAVLRVGPDEAVQQAFTRILDRLRAGPPGFQQMIAAETLTIMANVQGAGPPPPKRQPLAGDRLPRQTDAGGRGSRNCWRSTCSGHRHHVDADGIGRRAICR